MKNTYDVIIVGAGPAGSAAAYILSFAGMNVGLIDKAVFPRDKLCGGLLSMRARTVFDGIFGDAWGPAIDGEVHGASFFFKDTLINSIDSPHPFYMTSRKAFDCYLLELAAKKGPHIVQGAWVASIDVKHNEVAFKNGTILKADFIIGADGVPSRVADSLFPGSFNKNEYALGIQTDIQIDEMQGTLQLPRIYFGFIRWGYGWVFPKGGSISIGIGGLLGRNKDIKRSFQQFYRHVVGREPAAIKGHYIPAGNYKRTPGRGNILLVGDAAGLAEPITGEGIAFALLSGKFAAEAVLEAARIGDPNSACKIYKIKYNGVIKLFSHARLARNFIFRTYSEPFFISALNRSKTILSSYLDIIAGRIDYCDYTKIVMNEAVRSFFKRTARV